MNTAKSLVSSQTCAQQNSSFSGASTSKALRQPTSKLPRASTRSKVVTTKACGVLAVFDYAKGDEVPSSCSEGLVRSLCDRMGPRGPDGQGYGNGRSEKWHWALGHQRLSIMDPTPAGDQPFVKPDVSVAANGEIYNFKDLYKTLPAPVETQSDSDSEVLMHLYRAFGVDFVPKLDGMFAFVLVDQEKGTFLAARDPCGIKPLYLGRSKGPDGGKLMFASELKCLVDVCEDIEEFPAGSYYTPETGYVKYYQPSFLDEDFQHDPSVTAKEIRDELEIAVVKRMMSDVEFGMFLSGGIDSCIVGTLMRPHIPESKRLPSFTVGMKDSPDITAAREIAKILKYDHNERVFTSEEACSIIDKVIYHLETYNAELIRSSIPNFFLAEFASQQVKMCLTGEGSDELFGGYVYFHDAPNTQLFQQELNRIYGALGNVNLKRADRMTMAHGLEARVPFLDVRFTAKAMSLDPKLKFIGDGKYNREKAYLRNMFKGEIPEEILWRQKAMQCEGVGEDWVFKLQQYCEAKVSDEAFAKAAIRFPHDPPHSKEEYYYRDIFESYYPNLDRFTHVWEGGCRAGGAPWKSAKYSRAGLADVSALSHGLQENSFKDREGAGSATSALGGSAPRSTRSAGGGGGFVTQASAPRAAIGGGKKSRTTSLKATRRVRLGGVMRSRGGLVRASTAAQNMSSTAEDLETIEVVPDQGHYKNMSIEEVLLQGSDHRTELGQESNANVYNVGPCVMPTHLHRSSCTCNPLTPLARAGCEKWHPLVVSSGPQEFGQLMQDCVHTRLRRALQLPDGTGIITSPSGTDIELVPIAFALSLFPNAKKVHMLVSAVNEIGRGVAQAAGGEFTSELSPLATCGKEDLTTEDLTKFINLTNLDARDCEGEYLDHSAKIAEVVEESRSLKEPVVVHSVFGTKTNKRELFPAGTRCGDEDASAFVVVDACQGRYSRAELRGLLGQNALVTITGSKAMCGPPFSGAILIPPQMMKRLQAVESKDIWMPDMLQHYFTAHDFPASLPLFREKLPSTIQNRGLALRWLAAIEEMEAYFNAGADSKECRDMIAQWGEAVDAEIKANHPRIDVFEINDSVLNFRVTPKGSPAPLNADKLRIVYDLLTEDLTTRFAEANVSLTAEESAAAKRLCLIGQPVKICFGFGIIRLALGAPDMRAFMNGTSVEEALQVDKQILEKIGLIAENWSLLKA